MTSHGAGLADTSGEGRSALKGTRFRAPFSGTAKKGARLRAPFTGIRRWCLGQVTSASGWIGSWTPLPIQPPPAYAFSAVTSDHW